MPIRRTEFDSGLRVVTERMPASAPSRSGFWVLAGSRDEAPRISGSSHFLEHLLFKGTKRRSAEEIAQDFDAVGGDVNAFTAKEYTCYYARVLDRDLEMAVDHLADMLQHSVIRTSDLDAERQVILEEINMHEDSPEDVVHDLFTQTLWPDHPLGRPILGTVETIRDRHASVGGTLLPPSLRAGEPRGRGGREPSSRGLSSRCFDAAWRPGRALKPAGSPSGWNLRPVKQTPTRPAATS